MLPGWCFTQSVVCVLPHWCLSRRVSSCHILDSVVNISPISPIFNRGKFAPLEKTLTYMKDVISLKCKIVYMKPKVLTFQLYFIFFFYLKWRELCVSLEDIWHNSVKNHLWYQGVYRYFDQLLQIGQKLR